MKHCLQDSQSGSVVCLNQNLETNSLMKVGMDLFQFIHDLAVEAVEYEMKVF